MERAELRELLLTCLDGKPMQMILSGRTDQGNYLKVRIHPVLLGDLFRFQAEEFRGKQVFHRNLEREEAADYVLGMLGNTFRQLQAEMADRAVSVLVSKKGKITAKVKQKPGAAAPNVKGTPAQSPDLTEAWRNALSHDRKKNYILAEGIPVPFLIDLGVMTPEGKVVRARYDKFRQINRFLEFIEDVLPRLDKTRESVILDFGCGKSYLTFAMYYYLRELRGYPVRIIGLDLKDDVIAKCSGLARRYGYDKLSFFTGDIASYEGVEQVDMVVTLHACDTATDFALEKAVRWGAKVILSVPCCQHELNGQMENELLAPVFQYGIIRERMAALFTDALRAKLLEAEGYQVQILEFIDMEHTPKNLLIRAVKKRNRKGGTEHSQAGDATERLMKELHVEPTLWRLLKAKATEAEEA